MSTLGTGSPGSGDVVITTSSGTVESQLHDLLGSVELATNSDCLTYMGGILPGTDELLRETLEAIPARRDRLAVILETHGGYIEVAQRIVTVLRKHYEYVEFIVPNFAMSAGTVLVMSGDAIWMDYFSMLGPIDPQVQRPDGRGWVPALGYLIQYDRLIEKSNQGKLSTAEIAFLLSKFDPAELYRYEQARELSISLLKEWLVKYKFKNWRKTRTRGKKVTQAMKTLRAREVAKILNQTGAWHSHGHPISMAVLREKVCLEIEDLEQKAPLRTPVRRYYNLLRDYMMRLGLSGVLHVKGSFVPIEFAGT